ncbi:MAG: HTH-type transcriptional regulator ImmR [Pelotomaculum sp. PtaB.Bin104]|nr:MAG: HTH-type transcriptional regulator ImmR [Pelotomaculum sp. PtaB.Bin104]
MVYDLGVRLRELRESKNLSQTQVAKRLSLTRSSVSGYENNIAVPSIDVLSKMALLYGVTTDYILGIDNRKVIVLDGLTEREASVVQDMVNILIIEFKNRK